MPWLTSKILLSVIMLSCVIVIFQIGFNAGYGRVFNALPYSNDVNMVKDIDLKSGSEVVGRFIYSVAGDQIVRGGCTNDTILGNEYLVIRHSPSISTFRRSVIFSPILRNFFLLISGCVSYYDSFAVLWLWSWIFSSVDAFESVSMKAHQYWWICTCVFFYDNEGGSFG